MRLCAVLAFFFALFCVTSPALAAPGDVKASADADRVAVGDHVKLHLRALTSTGSMPTEPQLTANGMNFDASAPSVMPTQSVTISNGVMSQKMGLNVDWTLLARKVGSVTFTPRVKIDGKVVQANSVTIRVVPQGQAPVPQQNLGGLDPNDPFSSMLRQFGGPGFNPFPGFNQGNPFDQPTMPMQPAVPLSPKLALPAPRGNVAFLHAVLDKTSAVVGEQVTYSVYLYVDPDQREPDFNDVHEASAADFLKRNLLDDAQNNQPVEYAQVGAKIWAAKRIREWALFPLRSGNLEIGSMRLAVVGTGGPGSARNTEPLAVHVEDAPLAGRPPGFVQGNVGDFKLEADVSPRQVEEGGAIAVDLTLSGTGNLPATITPPPQKGVDWLAPEIHEDVAPTKAGTVAGSRRFTFVAHMNKSGDVDLGEIAVPFYDADKKAYDVARVTLGVITVKPNAAAEATVKSEEVLAGLPAVREGLRHDPPERHLADRPIFWLALLFSPMSFVAAAGGRAASRRAKSVLHARRASPESELAKRTADAKAAGKSGDARALDAAIVKMLEQAAIVRAGVNVRALSIDEMEDALVVRGVTREVAHDVVDVLRGCEESRFLPDAGDFEVSKQRLARALAAAGDLGKRKERA